MIAKYKWYILGGIALVGIGVYFKFFYNKKNEPNNPSGANETDLTISDSAASTKEMKERALRQEMDSILGG